MAIMRAVVCMEALASHHSSQHSRAVMAPAVDLAMAGARREHRAHHLLPHHGEDIRL